MPRRKQRRAWGHIDERIPGKKYVLRWYENTDTGRKRRCETVRGTYRQACARMAEIEVLHSKDKPTPTLETACNMWYLPWLETRLETGKIKQETADKYRKALYAHVLPRWRNTPVTAIKPIDIQSWLLEMNNNNARRSLIVAKTIVDFAVKYELAPSNKFAVGYELPQMKSQKEGTMYNLAQANEMFDHMHGTACETAFILQLFGSARVGESLAVRKAEVTSVEHMGMTFALVPIIRRMSNDNHLMPDGDLKTAESARTLIIPEPYSTRLLDLSTGGAMPDSEWLCPSVDGTCMTYAQFFRAWSRESAPHKIPPSNLRRSWRTFAQYEWGLDYDTCEVLMGHKLRGVTGEHYLKPSTAQLLDKVARAMKALSQN